MLHVGLLILKILGILLLSILGLVLLLLCIVLFVPVGYRLDMEKRERFKRKMCIRDRAMEVQRRSAQYVR